MGWENALTGIGPMSPPPPAQLETDEEFRARLVYVAGDSQSTLQHLRIASGPQLDLLAEEYELKRHTRST